MTYQNGIRVFPEAGGEIREGQFADFVLFEFKDRLAIKSIWLHEEKIY